METNGTSSNVLPRDDVIYLSQLADDKNYGFGYGGGKAGVFDYRVYIKAGNCYWNDDKPIIPMLTHNNGKDYFPMIPTSGDEGITGTYKIPYDKQ